MVKIIIKRDGECCFLYETETTVQVCDVITDLIIIHNGIINILQLCKEVEGLANYGACKIINDGLDGQLSELHLNSSWMNDFEPAGGFVEKIDPASKRCGRAPKEEMADILNKSIAEVRARVSKDQLTSNVNLNVNGLTEALQVMVEAITIVYPNGLPTHEPLEQDLKLILKDPKSYLCTVTDDNCIDLRKGELWWAGKKFERDKKLSEYVGNNEKTKITAKIQNSDRGPPPRESAFTPEDQRQLLLHQYKRQQELKKLEEDHDNSYLDSDWADNHYLKKSFQGLKDVRWKL